MKKRVASAFLVLTLLMSLAVVPAYAVPEPLTGDEFVDQFTAEMFNLSDYQKTKVVELMNLFVGLSVPEDFSAVYNQAIGRLLSNQGDEYINGLGLSFELLRDVTLYLKEDSFEVDNIAALLNVGDENAKDSFKEAFQLDDRVDDIEDIINQYSVTAENLSFAFTETKKFLNLLNTLSSSSILDDYLKVFRVTSVGGTLYLRSNILEELFELTEVIPVIEVDNPDEVILAFQDLVNYYNSSAVSGNDKDLIYDYFDNNGFIYLYNSGGGGGSNDDDDDTPAPVTPVTPPVNETVDDLTKDLEEKETEEVVEAIDSALDAINDSLEQGGTLEQVEELSTKLIEQLATITEEENKEELEELIADIAENAVEQAGRTEAETADLTEFDFSTASSAVNGMNETMQESLEAQNVEADKEFEVKVTVTVPTKSETEVEVEMPPLSEVFNEENGLDKVKLESEVASFEFGAGTFGDDSESVKIGAKVISANDVPEQHKEKVPQSATVVDLNAYVGTEKKTSFEKPIKVTVKYELKEGESADNVSVFLLKDDGTVVEVGGVYNEETGTISFLRDSFSLYYVSEAKATFNDIDNYPEAKKAIEVMAGKGIVKGRVVGVTFDPAANITRAEFACMITRALKIKGDASKLPFVDVPANAWYINDMAAAYQNNIVNGTSETKFAPSSNITREQAIAMVVNALSYMGYNYEDSASLIENVYTDFSELSTWFHNSTATAYREELIQDVFTGTELDPKTPITRAETAMLLYNLYFK